MYSYIHLGKRRDLVIECTHAKVYHVNPPRIGLNVGFSINRHGITFDLDVDLGTTGRSGSIDIGTSEMWEE